MANWLNLEGKVVAVTGGASGIGKHIASTLVAAGANTVVIDMNANSLDLLKSYLNSLTQKDRIQSIVKQLNCTTQKASIQLEI